MERQSTVKDKIKTFEEPANSEFVLKTMSPNSYIAMRTEKKQKETVVPIPENNKDGDVTNAAVTLANSALDTAQAPLMGSNNTPRTVPLPPIIESCWRENGCKIGACMGGTLAVIGTIFAVLAYLNDICVFPKCEVKPDVSKPCWENDVNYVSTRLGVSHNLLDEGGEFKKPSARECERSCETYSGQGCQYWTWNKVEQWCTLKKDRVSDPMLVDHYISGELGCIVPDNFIQISTGYNKNSSFIRR